MARRNFWAWRDDDLTADINQWLHGIIEQGRYRGFDWEPLPNMNLRLVHTGTGSAHSAGNPAVESAPAGILVTPQGVVVHEPDPQELPIAPLAAGAGRRDLVVFEHTYVEVQGGNPGGYSVIKGPEVPGATPVAPGVTNQATQTPIGVLHMPAGTTTLRDAGVEWEPFPTPLLGAQPPYELPQTVAFYDREQTWSSFQHFSDTTRHGSVVYDRTFGSFHPNGLTRNPTGATATAIDVSAPTLEAGGAHIFFVPDTAPASGVEYIYWTGGEPTDGLNLVLVFTRPTPITFNSEFLAPAWSIRAPFGTPAFPSIGTGTTQVFGPGDSLCLHWSDGSKSWLAYAAGTGIFQAPWQDIVPLNGWTASSIGAQYRIDYSRRVVEFRGYMQHPSPPSPWNDGNDIRTFARLDSRLGIGPTYAPIDVMMSGGGSDPVLYPAYQRSTAILFDSGPGNTQLTLSAQTAEYNTVLLNGLWIPF